MSRDSEDSDPDSNRRRFLKSTAGIALAAGLAGCPGDTGGGTPEGDGGDGTGDGGGDTPMSSPTPSPTETPTEEPETVSTPDEGVPTGGTFTVGLPEQPKGLNHLTTSSAYTLVITDAIYESGVFIDPVNFEIHPWLFTDWTIENVDSGQPDVYFDVRTDAGLTWTDGEEFTLEDVIFTYNYLMEQQPGNLAAALQPIKTVEEASNDWDVHMALSDTVSTWNSIQFSFGILPEHVWSQVDDYSKYRPTENLEDGEPIGLGPATVTQYQPTTSVEIQLRDADEYVLSNLDWLQEFQYLRAGGPFIDTVRFKVFSEDTALQNALFEGEIDTRYGQLRANAIERARNDESINLYQGKDTGWSYNMFNVRRTPLDDVAFRQFLAMLWDEVLWVRRLNNNRIIDGDVPWPPAYSNYRPEAAVDDAELTSHPAVNAFKFRQSSPGVPDTGGLKSFLTEGQVIDGSEGSFVGESYPGSLTGVSASQSSAKHDYSWGPVESQVLKDHGASEEIRVNGKTITEILGGPMGYHSYPPQVVPELTTMDQNFVTNMKQLGIPVERQVLEFNTLLQEVFFKQNFDITHLAVGIPSPFASQFIYSIFHGDNADNLNEVESDKGEEQANGSQQSGNASGYGLPGQASANDLISEGRNTITDVEQRRSLLRQAVERVYLDAPQMVQDYEKILWPVSDEFTGFIDGIPGPGGTNLYMQYLQLYKNE